VLLAGIIVVGMGIPAFFRWKVLELEEERIELLRNAPDEPQARLALWFQHGQPRIHEALVKARFSRAQPWIVSHVVAPASQVEAPEIWGIDVEDLLQDVVRQDGLVVRVTLPGPTLLARDVLVGDNALGVAVFAPDARPDGRVLARDRIEFFLARLIEALPRDIPGTRISVEIGGLVRPAPGAQDG
jgi:hypothetical protein